MAKQGRPRINESLYKEFQKLAIDNGTSVEIEVNKALEWAKEKRKNDPKRNGGNTG